ncbi:hypothetical protein ACLD43_02400 [Clostridium botulinum]|uniref:hypothetical protein n=1 Tax=Clostridium botulinum TaxID=1491 RepID=UPI0007E02973|nr:hypothetical protein [Clostridium botulinum]KEJ00278.1 hypothetical protein N494_04605 [Clostridium botulinum A2B7 92]
MPLKIVTNELLIKSAVGYLVIDLMRESSHIDLLGHLFDVFTKLLFNPLYTNQAEYIIDGCLIDDYIKESSVGEYFDKILKVKI